ncbi:uncharacterized protein N7515_003598 [Penicillium bovifimosum]|uniref:Ankyrin repeat protein n=1 Tax=Penicillium bovifimosum TaxID=126998 RepID=A0A9W9L6C9_9EURO|nr:uncharacterized protein N7515_003598 [Penicillium bovifimosum]KAJ5138750.1 hypothetical protein N7515_003598 [Penicillium bovifimosum]
MAASLPTVPVKHNDFLSYVQSQPNTPMADLVKPYNEFDALLRKAFAQEPSNPLVKDNLVNIVPMYDRARCNDLRIRARDLASETPEQKAKYILPLSDKDRKPNGSPAIVPTFDEFKNNFTLFTEGSLSEIDWSNVVVAGSAVVTSLLPVPEQYRNSKRGLRQWYHEKFAPASDVDLFLYGLNEEQAVEKIKHIEDKIKNTILYETTTIRTKNTITIASQYPNRHVQIVLRIYRSIAEILTGFDVDVSCTAFDGRQVYASPRAIAAYATQVNQIDLTRRSPSYENRLSKYSHRGFEVFWDPLSRSRVDPTIFERSFNRTVGLARLLVLERLPKSDDRDEYLRKRRQERGRPPLNIYMRRRQGRELKGNIKDDWEDEVPEWQEADQVSDYHTFTIPYGRNFNAKKIEKLLYTKDLLLNAQWNQGTDRDVYLHRHPAFFGEAEHVIHDCCGFCPTPATDEERKVAEEESKIYVSGDISFLKDDPGRQEIGSFNPITETDWTEMAYVGRTERLCRAIVADDLAAVEACLAEEGSDPNRRDYTGRTPLQLACISSTPEIVEALLRHGARMIPRMADGKTALHLAAARGHVEIIRILLTKSNENEEAEAQKQDALKKNKKEIDPKPSADQDDEEIDESDEDDASRTSASYVKVEKEPPLVTYDTIEENDLEPDVYDVNVVAWDSRASPLHLAMLNGHIDVVKELVSSFGADVLLPVKILNDYNRKPEAAILNLVLAFSLPSEKAMETTRALLELGASVAQADLKQQTALYYSIQERRSDMLELYFEHDMPAVKRAINHLAVSGGSWSPSFSSPLMEAVRRKMPEMALKLLNAGAKPDIELSELVKAYKMANPDDRYFNGLEDRLSETMEQPVFLATTNDLPLIAMELLDRGANPNTTFKQGWGNDGQSLLDSTRSNLEQLRACLSASPVSRSRGQLHAMLFDDDEFYLAEFPSDSYRRFAAKASLEEARNANREIEERIEKEESSLSTIGVEAKMKTVSDLIRDYEKLETRLLASDAKTWAELHPEDPRNNVVYPQVHYPEVRKKAFKLEFKFNRPGLSDIQREGYFLLFEAAWNGDLQTIQYLTLGMWGPAGDQAPLEIAVTGDHGLSCLSISIMRGHLDVAKSVLDILRQQYMPEQPRGQTRFELGSDDESDDEENLNIVGETIDDTFTHDNVGEVVTKTESKVSPIRALQFNFTASLFLDPSAFKEATKIDTSRMLSYPSGQPVSPKDIVGLVRFAIYKNDLSLLDFILEMEADVTRDDPSEINAQYTRDLDFQLAISLGRVDCLTKLIQHSATGLPLAKLSSESGVEAPKEPRYYQGLSIRGAKRSDWANAGRHETASSSSDKNTPLLISAFQGNLASTEFFLGTAPGRYYLEYVNSHPENKDVKRISKSKLGLEASVLNWLQTRNNLVLHCAVMSKPNQESERLVQYLIDHHPECLEAQSESGKTPLALAFTLRRVNCARMLIEAGANQATRDSQAYNLLHMLLDTKDLPTCSDSKQFTELVSLLDEKLIPTLLTQRAGEDARTPFAHWLNSYHAFHPQDGMSSNSNRVSSGNDESVVKTNHEIVTSMTNAILDLAAPTNQKHLELFDGTGNTPAHMAVRQNYPQILGQLLDRRPDLLYRENSTGTTPLEMAVDAWVNHTISARNQRGEIDSSAAWVNVAQRQPGYFDEAYRESNKREESVQIMLRVCQERARQSPSKRRLVSLFEANEVAKRLATTQRASDNNRGRYFRRRRGHGEQDGGDEVEQWTCRASQW